MGLNRSLVTAGVSSLVVSLWQIPDSLTAQLMVLFYQDLTQIFDKETALKKSMLEMKKCTPIRFIELRLR